MKGRQHSKEVSIRKQSFRRDTMSRHPLATAFNVLLLLYCPWYLFNGAIASVPCGFPGKPTNGSITPEKTYYSEGETVKYSCPNIFWIFNEDSTVRSCKNGSWNGTMPYCNPEILKGQNAEIIPPSKSASKTGYLTDHDSSTCLELGPEQRMNQKRSLKFNLGKLYGIRIIFIYPRKETLLDIEIFVSDSSTNKKGVCGSYKGTVTDKYIRIDCTTASDTKGFPGGVPGDSVTIEVNAPSVFCDIQANAYYGNTDCGLPEIPAFGSVEFISKNTFKYSCKPGFLLIGTQHRTCDPDGGYTYWPKENMPICREIGSNCPSLSIPNARISYDLNGLVALIDCDVGFELAAAKVLLCIKPSTWVGYVEHGGHCKRKIGCGSPPSVFNAEIVKTKVISQPTQAIYVCKETAKSFYNDKVGVSYCLENGTWSTLPETFRCQILTTTSSTIPPITTKIRATPTVPPSSIRTSAANILATSISRNTATAKSSVNSNISETQIWNTPDFAQCSDNFWTLPLLCATAVAVFFVAMSVFLGCKLARRPYTTQLQAVQTSSTKTAIIQYERNKCNISLDSSSPHTRAKSRSCSPIYEEVGLQNCIRNQTKKKETKPCPQTESCEKEMNKYHLGLAIGASVTSYDNIALTPSSEAQNEYEFLHGYENFNRNIESVYQNISGPSPNAYANM